ncbi:hypothetical protein BO86DRAFT_394649 [Aspergillus japonicus CBS 114.51]|uniref:H-type lectin domain-containing protein n=1 Tax=Aspergillus japonicus CBS 114.51 TaxID=1448312 RepID=A0A8T8XEX6_ASPJA|nr:hypothetical protein BO86DRAFT_394649 [Aspergillus japonicus CBS 114.51]RAH86853.1 hypothetical protein BO86DRAFT_394649 [Aspergillus japonicus CBS 114.51]
MALLLAPYNNGMRLGQGFNTYTQQICIDDAVVIDPDRVDNAVTNDGFTMRELRYAIGARAGDNDDQDESVDESPLQLPLATDEILPSTAPDEAASATKQMIGPAPPTALDSMAIQLSQDVKTVTKLVEEIAALEASIEDALDVDSAATKRDTLLLEKKRMRLARLKTTGTGLKSANPRHAARDLSRRGPSQIVSYNSRFVNKISEITDDMNISGSLSIKYGAVGGSGKGSFVDTDKFKESDLNFFISVKVINQSINIKDALVFQGLPSVNEDNFRTVFGDAFISGFLEGGEFNALVSMKVINKDKRMSVKAEAEIALSVGGADIHATADVGIGKTNFSSQTETTIQVVDQPWTIQTLMATAAKFPDLVANTPQRTYAILTKYESLRSFMALKPPALKPLFYENAAIYTNTLLDAYMDYKNVYRTLSTYLADIQAGTKKFGEEWPTGTALADATTLGKMDDESRFPPTIKGLDLARRACRFQMVKIVKEVDAIETKPDLAADETREEAYQSPIVFRERLPLVKDKEKMPHLKIFGTDVPYPPLLDHADGDGMSEDEVAKAASYKAEQPDVSEFQRLAPMVGSATGSLFCNLDFIKPDFSLRSVRVAVHNGVVAGLSVRYANGLLAAMGTVGGDRLLSLDLNAEDGEKIIACSIETGREEFDDDPNAPTRVTAIRLYTNRGPDLLGNAEDWKPAVNGRGIRGGVAFKDLTLTHFDPLLVNSHVKGFWGYGITTTTLKAESGLYRLAPIWGNKESITPAVGAPVDDRVVDPAKIVTEAQELRFAANTHRNWQGGKPGGSAVFEYHFPKPLPIVPTILYGLRCLDVNGANSPRFALELPTVSESGFTLALKTFLHPTLNIEANVLVLPNGKIPFQHGLVDASDTAAGRTAAQNAAVQVTFAKPFADPEPKVFAWFTAVSQPRGRRKLTTYITDVTAHGMTVHIDTDAGCEFESAQVAWLAWPREDDGRGVRAGNSVWRREDPVSDAPWYGGGFSRTPKVFCGINHLDFPECPDTWLRVFGKHEQATKERLRWHAGTWQDTPMNEVGVCWIGLE